MTYDQAIYRFRTFHNTLLQSKTKNYDGKGEGPIVQKLQSKDQKNSGHMGQVGFTPVCFKYGTAAHYLRDCKVKITPCSFQSCSSSSHNTAGHQVMLDLGKTVSSDKTGVAAAGSPAAQAPKGNKGSSPH